MQIPPLSSATALFPRAGAAALTLVVVCLSIGWSCPAAAQEPEPPSFLEAVRQGTTRLDLRYRFEFVDSDATSRQAVASTLRTVLTYESGRFRGFDFVLQATNVSDLGATARHANAGFGHFGNGVTGRPVIADPAFTALSQGFVRYRNGETGVAAGRQEIVIGDARHVGNVGWRQHHQTYRALRVTDGSLDNLSFGYAYVDRVYRVTGATQATSSHLFDATYTIERAGALSGYAWILDFESAPTLSTRTLGLEWKGVVPLGGELSMPYEVEIARQTDIADSPQRLDASYAHVSAGITGSGYQIRIGWERLGGNRIDGRFSTTLATLHAFNGWADQFLNTPPDGLDDLYLSVSGPVGPLSLRLDLHDFSAASTEVGYGREIDFQAEWRASWNQLFGLRGAIYAADEFAADTTKLWLYSAFSF